MILQPVFGEAIVTWYGLSAIIDKLHCLEYLALPSTIHIQIKPDSFEGVSNYTGQHIMRIKKGKKNPLAISGLANDFVLSVPNRAPLINKIRNK